MVDEGVLLVLVLLLVVVLIAAGVVDVGIVVEIGGAIMDEVVELSAGSVDFGKPRIEIFDVTEEETEAVLVVLGASPDTVTGLPYSVVPAPRTTGTPRVRVLPAWSVKYTKPVVVVAPSSVSELWEFRLRLPMADVGIGVPLSLQVTCSGAIS